MKMINKLLLIILMVGLLPACGKSTSKSTVKSKSLKDEVEKNEVDKQKDVIPESTDNEEVVEDSIGSTTKRPERIKDTYSAVALKGAVIIKQSASSIKFKKKCEACGKLQSGTTSISKGRSGSKKNSSFRCFYCKKTQKVVIQVTKDN